MSSCGNILNFFKRNHGRVQPESKEIKNPSPVTGALSGTVTSSPVSMSDTKTEQSISPVIASSAPGSLLVSATPVLAIAAADSKDTTQLTAVKHPTGTTAPEAKEGRSPSAAKRHKNLNFLLRESNYKKGKFDDRPLPNKLARRSTATAQSGKLPISRTFPSKSASFRIPRAAERPISGSVQAETLSITAVSVGVPTVLPGIPMSPSPRPT